MELSFIWAGIIAFAVLAYVVLDGFDLGIGILFPWLGEEEDRELAMATVAPVWDGNETWLVLGGGGLFAVLPLAYAVVMPALYPLIVAMLLGLIFRGVAFEFIFRTTRWRRVWERGFFAGSLVAALAQGMALGALVQGIEVEGRAFGGGFWDWLTPFSALCAAALVAGYVTLGLGWLLLKTEGGLRARCHRLALPAGVAFLLAIGAVSLATPFLMPQYLGRWFAGWTMAFTLLVPVALGAAAWAFRAGLARGRDSWPFLATLAAFGLAFAGLGIGFYPDIVPPGLTIAEAAAPDASLLFLLVGSVVLIPMILAYTGYSYWVFRGRVRPGQRYH